MKIKAGRITPALATTTACVSALQTVEVIKCLKQVKLELFKNSFLNFAVPNLYSSEPGAPDKIRIREDLVVTIWDQWKISCSGKDLRIQDIISQLEATYKLIVSDIFLKNKPLFSKNQEFSNPKKYEDSLQLKISQFLPEKPTYFDLTVAFKLDKEKDILSNTPPVRIYF